MSNNTLELFKKIEALAAIYPNIINRINSLCDLYNKRITSPDATTKEVILTKLSLGATTINEVYEETLIPYNQVKIIVEQLIEEGKVEVRYAPKQRGGQLKPGRKAKMFFIKERKD